jgi:hypothetical protein
MNRHPLELAALAAWKAAEGCECRSCGTVVSDGEWKAVCELNGLTAKRDVGMRTCPLCIRKARTANPKRRLAPAPSRPALGLRIAQGDHAA